MSAWYNENDPYVAEFLRNLIAAGHIAPGVVDERDIRDVFPADITGFTQCHFFAGIGIWSYALRQAGWKDGRQVWTGSCPCQPFSAAGRRKGAADERHLWPHWFHLIRECRPHTVFGEQVASKDGLAWLDIVQADMEGVAYALGAVPFPAASVGAPETSLRIYFVGEAEGERRGETGQGVTGPEERNSRRGETCELASTMREQRNGRGNTGPARRPESPICCNSGDVGRPHVTRPQGRGQRRNGAGQRTAGQAGMVAEPRQPGPVNGFWRDADWLFCTDGKWRAVEGGTFPLAHGDTNRVGSLRAYGNALHAPQATEFIGAYIEAER